MVWGCIISYSVARYIRIVEVSGSNPLCSTTRKALKSLDFRAFLMLKFWMVIYDKNVNNGLNLDYIIHGPAKLNLYIPTWHIVSIWEAIRIFFTIVWANACMYSFDRFTCKPSPKLIPPLVDTNAISWSLFHINSKKQLHYMTEIFIWQGYLSGWTLAYRWRKGSSYWEAFEYRDTYSISELWCSWL